MGEIIPADRDTKRATFEAPCKDFKISEKAQELFMSSTMEDLENFRFYFTGEEQIDSLVATVTALKDDHFKLQVSRVRRAWTAVRAMGSTRDARKDVVTTVELDDPLEEATLLGEISLLEALQAEVPC